jgi:periplasmic protein TonB
MAQARLNGASPNAHFLIGEMPAPRQLQGRWWEGTGLSIAAHAIVFGILIYAAAHVPQVVQTVGTVTGDFVFRNRTGPGGRDGGRGTTTTDPPRGAQIPRTKPLEVTPVPNPADTPPIPEMNIPVITLHAEQMLPGALAQMDTTSPGRGSGPGGGGGRGPGGGGPGDGTGLGPGGPGGFGGEGFGIGADVTQPLLIKEVKPNYTVEAMRAKLQGTVEMDAVVLPDGSVDPGSIRITRSLDSTFGLDQQAVIAVKQWHFRPGTFKGKAVAVRVNVELTFTLR